MTSTAREPGHGLSAFDPARIHKPAPKLMTYYFITSLAAGPLFLFPLIPLYLKYRSLTYRFDEEGVSMSWGILFRHEINLTYRRIQDIHLTRNIIERWMGLATVAVQTASGNAGAEMTIQGVPQASELRDFLYSRMRGSKGTVSPAAEPHPAQEDEAVLLLREIRDLLRAKSSNIGQGGR
jgi:putative membrane protein